MANWKRNVVAVAAAGALLLALVSTVPNRTEAANLTGGQYTYVINGDEVSFPFDPVVRKDGMLLPIEVFQQFGVNVAGAVSRNLELTKDEVDVQLTVGSNTAVVNAVSRYLGTAPVRLNGRVFVPAEVLREFGVDYSQDDKFLSMRTLIDTMPKLKTFTDSEWGALKAGRWFSVNVKTDAGLINYSDWQLLTAESINSTNLGFSYGVRARLTSLLETNTLVWVKMANVSNKTGGLVTGTTFLIDNNRNQYEVASVLDIGEGLLNGKIAPGADRAGVLVFPKIDQAASQVSVYYENNQATLGYFMYLK